MSFPGRLARFITACPHRRRVGFVGLTESGKTTLLTAIINHLRDHCERFSENAEMPMVTGHRAIQWKSRRRFITEFRYEDVRDGLQRGDWPEKTLQLQSYRCMLRLKYRKREPTLLLDLVDLPGERFVDAKMFEARDYASWSDEILRVYRHIPEPAKSLAEPFLSLVKRVERQPASLDFAAY